MTQGLTLDNTDPLDGGDYLCTITNDTAMTTLNGKICQFVETHLLWYPQLFYRLKYIIVKH